MSSNLVYEYLMYLVECKNINISENDKIILESIRDNKVDLINSTTNEISKNLYFSKSSLTRFSKKFGYKGFTDLKYDLSLKINERPNSVIELAYKDVIDNMKSFPKDIIDLAENLDKFRRICIFGIGSSGIAAKEYNYRLSEVGLSNVFFADEPYNLNIEAKQATAKDLIIGLSISGQNKDLIDSLKVVAERKAAIFGISSNTNSKLKEISDYFLKVPSPAYSISKIFPLLYSLDSICYYFQNSHNIH